MLFQALPVSAFCSQLHKPFIINNVTDNFMDKCSLTSLFSNVLNSTHFKQEAKLDTFILGNLTIHCLDILVVILNFWPLMFE